VDPQCLGQRIVDRGVVVSKLLPQCLLSLGLVKMGGRHAGMAQPLLRAHDSSVGAGDAA
jgi:hypothetical protein